MLKKILFINLIISIVLSSDIEKTNLELYSESMESFFNNDTTQVNIFELFDDNYTKYKNINISIPQFSKSSQVELRFSNEKNDENTLVINSVDDKIDYLDEKLFMVLCINSFLSGSFEFSFNEKELNNAFDYSGLNRRINIQIH